MTNTKENEHRKAYLIGGGIASLSAAVFMIRDGHVKGKNITILEERRVNGGSLDGSGTEEMGYVIRGGRMLNEPTYECTWSMLDCIPSLDRPGISVKQEIQQFSSEHPTHSKARVVDASRHIVDVEHMQFSNQDRLDIGKLLVASEESLGTERIKDWFEPEFFETNFWYMWATMFAFQPWHSLVEFKRYMIRFMHEFPRINTLEGVARTPYNQYDSIVLPVQTWLQEQGVRYDNNIRVTDIVFRAGIAEKTVERIIYERDGVEASMEVAAEDLVFFTNGSMTEASDLGTMQQAPKLGQKGSSFRLWEKLASTQTDFGNPSSFADHIEGSKWESFTVTCTDPLFFDFMESFTDNVAGSGGLVTFKDSNWLMSIVLAHQPHFRNQPEHIQVFWGYGLFPDRVGNYVDKKMSDCTGEEVLQELMGHLKFNAEQVQKMLSTSNCIPCMMPFITSQFMPRAIGDRPQVVPQGSTNFAFLGQYTELPEDVVFTVEYSVRSAQTAVYQLLHLDMEIPAVYHGRHHVKVLWDSLTTMIR
ncbi:oleate hydratase [Paenibacillus shirakamiensis]|uniref:Oleate hydratase n=1 Tax=Paenibacillus shirakamiensis TaxID=1265935 RepID=A0ABS4JF68_9BACL|nr:oleate hydratase [Paenibacillus shirakamiensis]MBP2000359.1 oleate hydratase [Paenibacillus shirakamiensis]